MQNIGLVGLGFIGKAHFNAYQKMDQARVAAICTRSEVTDKEILTKFQGSFIKNYDELLNNQTIDIIDICLPSYLHEAYIIKAADAGKHIICEKPLTLTEESADRIMDAVNRNGVELFVGHILRFWPEYELIKSYSQSDKLKGIEFVHAKRLSQFPAWSNWFKYPEKSGGALFDLHIHDIDFVYYLLGEVESIYAVGSQNKHGAWNHIMTTLRFKDKSKAFVEASNQMPDGYPFTMSCRASTGESTLEFSVVAGENIEGIDESNNQLTYYHANENRVIDMEKVDPFYKQLSYFVSCVENKTENDVISLEDVSYVFKLLKGIKTSLETGQLVNM
ncbi:Gfo/Idh/MocA family oxidoreductase [Virgibacillus oceani]